MPLFIYPKNISTLSPGLPKTTQSSIIEETQLSTSVDLTLTAEDSNNITEHQMTFGHNFNNYLAPDTKTNSITTAEQPLGKP